MSVDTPNPRFFGHLFKVDDRPFYYCANTQEMVSLEPPLAAAIEHFGDLQRGVFPEVLKGRFTPAKIREALAILETVPESEGLFAKGWPRLVSAEPVEPRLGRPDRPLQHLILTLTEDCNLRCGYCMHGAGLDWVRPHRRRAMPKAIALQAARYFLERCEDKERPTVSFYGGEALLQVDVLRAVAQEVRRHPRGRHAFLVIDTNGVLLDDEIIELVTEHRIHLQVSLDGPQWIHDRQRRDAAGNPTYGTIMKSLDGWLSRDPEAYARLRFICTVVPPTDLLELDAFFGNFPLFAKHGIEAEPGLEVNMANLRGQNWPATKADRHLHSRRELPAGCPEAPCYGGWSLPAVRKDGRCRLPGGRGIGGRCPSG